MGTILIAIIVLGLLIFVHEFGHFIIAKMSGMRVEEFSIGMGPEVMKKIKGDTMYSLRAFPFGGYVRVTGAAGEMDENMEDYDGLEILDPDDPRRYNNRPIWQRFIFGLAGSGMNFILAIILLTGLCVHFGVFDTEAVLDNEISFVSEDSGAYESGIRAGDKILSIAGREVKLWEDVSLGVEDIEKDKPVAIVVERDGKVLNFEVYPQFDESRNKYLLGVSKSYPHREVGIVEGFEMACMDTVNVCKMLLDAVGNLLTGEVAINDEEEGLSGPVGIVKVIDQSAQQGLPYLLRLTALLSINLALFNLLPIPGLDGSRLLFILIEGIRGKAVDPAKENIVNLIGFAFLMMLMIYVTYNDIIRLFD